MPENNQGANQKPKFFDADLMKHFGKGMATRMKSQIKDVGGVNIGSLVMTNAEVKAIWDKAETDFKAEISSTN